MNLPVPAAQPQPFPLQPWAMVPPPTQAGFTVTPEQKLELLEYWRSITKRKWAILALACIVAVLAALFAYSLSPVYRATATVLVEPGKVKVVSIEEVYSNNQQQNVATQMEILRSRDVAERAARRLKLWEHPAFDPRKAQPSWFMRAKATLGMAPAARPPMTDEAAQKAVLGALAGRLIVEPIRGSQLVRISFESEDAKLAADVVNAAVAEYIDSDKDERFRVSSQVSTFLQERMQGLKEKMLQSEQALQAYREEKGIVSLGGSAQAVTGRQLTGALDRVQAAKAKRLELESAYQQARAAQPQDYAEIPFVRRDPSVMETLRQMDAARRNVLTLQETYNAGHYRAQQAQEELGALQKLLTRQAEVVVASLKREYEGARSTEALMEASVGSAQGGVQSVNREEFRLQVLERDAASNRQLYELFLGRAKETNLAGDVQAPVARVIDQAVPNFVPVRPDKAQIVIRAAILALFLGALASLLMDKLDNTVKGGNDAEVRLRLPVLTALPMVDEGARPKMARIFLDESHSHYAEGIRTARTGVMLSNLDVPHKILLITSTLPGEGKTTVAVNLALAHAQTKRTLLIDCDMRRAQAGKSLGLSGAAKGLTNLVAGNASPEECLVLLKDTKLHVLPVGDLPPNPLELILSQRFKEALKALSEHFEMIVIDSPPVELVSEALVLAPMATSVAFVVKAMSTPAPLARKSITRLQRAGGNMLGLIVNQLDFSHAQRYYGEYGSKDYAYGGYGGYGSYGSSSKAGPNSKLPRAPYAAADKALPRNTKV